MSNEAKTNALKIVTDVINSFGKHITEEREMAERLAYVIELGEEIEAIHILEAMHEDLSRNQIHVIEAWIQTTHKGKGYKLCIKC